MVGYIGSKAVTLSTTAADVTGDATINGNLTVNGTTITVDSAAAQEIRLGDNDKMTFGDATGGDLQIYHDGFNSYIDDAGTGGLIVRADNFYVRKANDVENMIIGSADGAVTLYHDNATKLATTSTGVDITGTLTSDGLTVQGDTYLNTAESPVVTNVDTWAAQTTNALRIGVSSNADYNSVAGYGGIQFTESGWGSTVASIGVGSWSGDGTEQGYAQDIVFHMKQSGASNDFDKVMRITRGGDISFYEDTGTTAKFFWDASAESLGIGTTSPSHLIDGRLSGTSSGEVISVGNVTTGSFGGIAISDGGTYPVQHWGSSLEFYTGNSTYSSATERMRIGSNGDVGIGTTTPMVKLHVHDSTAARFALTNSTTGQTFPDGFELLATGLDAYVQNRSNGNMIFTTNNTERMRIDSSGNVGFGGITSPQAGFGVSGCIDTNGAYFARGQINSHQTNAAVLQYGNNLAELRAYGATAGSGQLRFMTGGGGGSADTERMRIDSSGRVGIGTSSPSSPLHVVGDSSGGFLGGGIRINDTNNSSDWFIGGAGSGTLQIAEAAGSTRMVFDTSGNVGVGITPTVRLHVYGTAGNYNSIFRNGSDSGQGMGFQRADGTHVGSITWASSTVSFNTTSDYRLKENVTDVTDGITRVKQLSPKRFNFIVNPDITVDGFLAHEAQTVVPEAVTGTHNEVDDDGNAVMQGIDQSKLVPLLTAALQEAIAKIETLETEMTSVKARLDALEAE